MYVESRSELSAAIKGLEKRKVKYKVIEYHRNGIYEIQYKETHE